MALIPALIDNKGDFTSLNEIFGESNVEVLMTQIKQKAADGVWHRGVLIFGSYLYKSITEAQGHVRLPHPTASPINWSLFAHSMSEQVGQPTVLKKRTRKTVSMVRNLNDDECLESRKR